MQTPTRLRGQVKWFNNREGYGYILRNGERDVFVHYTAIRGTGYRTLTDGETVSYELENNDKGPRAVDVVRENAR